jgi:hypothetical protein
VTRSEQVRDDVRNVLRRRDGAERVYQADPGARIGVLAYTTVDGDFVNDSYPNDGKAAPADLAPKDAFQYEPRPWFSGCVALSRSIFGDHGDAPRRRLRVRDLRARSVSEALVHCLHVGGDVRCRRCAETLRFVEAARRRVPT